MTVTSWPSRRTCSASFANRRNWYAGRQASGTGRTRSRGRRPAVWEQLVAYTQLMTKVLAPGV